MAELNDVVETSVALGQKLGRPVTEEKIHYAVVPDGSEIVSLESYQYAENPIRKQASVTLFDVNSFTTYYTLFSDEESRIFANPDKRTFTAVIDYHESGGGLPRFRQHQATLTCRTTEEWDTWYSNNNKAMEQVAFALFLEDNISDIVRPSGAEMLEGARRLKAKKDVDFSSDVNLTNGQAIFHYQETIQGRVGGGEIEIPETFALRFPIFWGGIPHDIEARLRWRISSEKRLMFWYTLIRAKKMLESSFLETVEKIEAETKATVLLGAQA